MTSHGGNSKLRDRYLEKGMTFCTPEQLCEVLDRAKTNESGAAEMKRKRDPLKQQELLAEAIRDGLKGSFAAGVRASIADDEAAEAKARAAALETKAKGK